MTTVNFGYSPGAWVASQRKSFWYETGVAADVVGAAGYVISNIIGRPRTPRSVEEFMHGDVASGFYTSSLPLILVGGVALIVVVGLLGKR